MAESVFTTNASTKVAVHPNTSAIMRLYAVHRALLAACDEAIAANASEDEVEELFMLPADRIEARIMSVPCETAADFAVKVLLETARGELVPDWDTGAIWKEARALIGVAA